MATRGQIDAVWGEVDSFEKAIAAAQDGLLRALLRATKVQYGVRDGSVVEVGGDRYKVTYSGRGSRDREPTLYGCKIAEHKTKECEIARGWKVIEF